ncbi:ras-related protein Rab-3-like [Argiope bruennichi]|uniref:Ras-related protein Rab-3 like protein n=1 Tax=Argiope bruennichi TaxID=94029 RepID=A0A8T0F4D1_ARGBR|nr:ras-related protein Rab-3-like [Argiope bruennichi]KAF8785701.1 Ras-related protein Rab-3 like protein [Argiope bruennichi]
MNEIHKGGRKSRNWKSGEEIKSKILPANFSAPFVIFGGTKSGRKTFALRLADMNADKLPEYEAQPFFSSFHIWAARPEETHRTVTLHLMAYIYPPPEKVHKSYKDQCMAMLDKFCCRVFLFDITSRESFNTARDYMVRYANNSPVPCFLVGNKSDLKVSVPQLHIVTREYIEQAIDMTNIKFFECSAKTKLNVQPVLEAIQDSVNKRKYLMQV